MTEADREAFCYAARYCEENVWWLAADDRVPAGRRHVVFLTNEAKSFPMWRQRCAAGPEGPVVWDYHVVLLVTTDAGTQVWDLDSRLSLGTPLAHYLDESFPLWAVLGERLAPMFRVVEAETYRRELASDRSHMRADNGVWAAPPPSWPCIGDGNNLPRYWTTRDDGAGTLCRTICELRTALG